MTSLDSDLPFYDMSIDLDSLGWAKVCYPIGKDS